MTVSWVYVCPECGEEIKVEEEEYPEVCPNCGSIGEFDIFDEEEEP